MRPLSRAIKGDKGKAENGKPAAKFLRLRQTEAITYQFAAALMRSIKNAYNGRRTSPHGFSKLEIPCADYWDTRRQASNLSPQRCVGAKTMSRISVNCLKSTMMAGCSPASDPAEAPHVRDGGAPTPETGNPNLQVDHRGPS